MWTSPKDERAPLLIQELKYESPDLKRENARTHECGVHMHRMTTQTCLSHFLNSP